MSANFEGAQHETSSGANNKPHNQMDRNDRRTGHNSGADMPRLFVGLALSESVRENVSNIPVHEIHSFTPVPSDNFHITLHFLGRCSMESAKTALQSVKGYPFALTVGGIGVFPSPSNPRVVWAGVHPSPNLLELKSDVDRALTAAGLSCPDKNNEFSPHITIAKAKQGGRGRRRNRFYRRDGKAIKEVGQMQDNATAQESPTSSTSFVDAQASKGDADVERLLTAFENFQGGQFLVDSFILYESKLSMGQLVYEAVEQFDLVGETTSCTRTEGDHIPTTCQPSHEP